MDCVGGQGCFYVPVKIVSFMSRGLVLEEDIKEIQISFQQTLAEKLPQKHIFLD